MPEHDELREHAGEVRRREDVGYENTDIQLIPVLAVVVALGIVLFTTGKVAMLFMQQSERMAGPAAQAPRERALPKEPRLEPLAAGQPNNAFHAIEQERLARLNSFGPTDEPGYVHVPIEYAMRRVESELQGSGSQPAAAANQKSKGLKYAGDANSGRVFRKEQP